MIVTLQSTAKVVDLIVRIPGSLPSAVPARIWEGTTDSGIPVHAYITRIAVSNDQRQAEFQKELLECKAPSKEIEAIPMRMII